jgi:hypothetical protein
MKGGIIMSKKLKETLQFLGSDYSARVIDGVESIYRKISDDYEIKVTGLKLPGEYRAGIYIWTVKSAKVLERHIVFSKEELKTTLDKMIVKYSAK